MPTPLDWHMYVLPLQDFDKRTEIPYRTCMAGVRINEPEAGDFVPAQTDRGSVEGAFLAKATGPERDYVHAWFLGAAGYIQAAEAKKTATGSGTQVRQGNASGQTWLPIKRDDPDSRFEPAAVRPPAWYDGKFPTGWPGVVTQGTQEHEQNLTLHPSFFGLVAVNDGGDPKCGTLVHELDDKGRVETSQHLQSIFTVTDLGAGACGAGGKAVALTLAKSKQDNLSGHLPLVEWLGAPAGGIQPANAPAPPAKLTAMLALPGGSPLHSGGLGDRHVIGKDADGDPIVLPHWNPEATIWKIHEGDGPQKFSPAPWQKTENLSGVWQEVEQRWKFDETHSACGGSWSGKWAWQVKTPLYEPDRDRFPPPPQPPKDTVGVVNSPTGTLIGEYNPDPKYVAINQCFIASELAIRGAAWLAGQVDLTGNGNPTEHDLALADNMPLAAKIRGVVTGTGTWDGADTSDTNPPGVNLPANESGLAILPPDQSMTDLMTGVSYDGPGAAFWIPESTKLIFGTPQADGSLKNAVSIQSDGNGDATLTFADSGGSTTTASLSDIGSGGGGDGGAYTGSNGFEVSTHEYVEVLNNASTVVASTGREIATPIPVGATIIAVVTRVLTTPDGAGTNPGVDSYSVTNASGGVARYGTSVDIVAGSTTGPEGPISGSDHRTYVGTAGAGQLRITPNGWSGWGAGQIRIQVLYETTTPPTS